MASREILVGMHDAYQEILEFLKVSRSEKEIKDFLNNKIDDMNKRHKSIQGVELCQKTKEEPSN